jgi:hypothetical protein
MAALSWARSSMSNVEDYPEALIGAGCEPGTGPAQRRQAPPATAPRYARQGAAGTTRSCRLQAPPCRAHPWPPRPPQSHMPPKRLCPWDQLPGGRRGDEVPEGIHRMPYRWSGSVSPKPSTRLLVGGGWVHQLASGRTLAEARQLATAAISWRRQEEAQRWTQPAAGPTSDKAIEATAVLRHDFRAA